MGSFLSNLDHAHVATIDQGSFEEIITPSSSGKNRLEGIDFNKTRTKAVATVLLALSMKPNGFVCKDLADGLSYKFDSGLSRRRASYELKKFRGKGLVKRIDGSIKYVMTEKGIKIISAILCMLNHELPALSSLILSPLKEMEKEQLSGMDEILFSIQKDCDKIRELKYISLAS